MSQDVTVEYENARITVQKHIGAKHEHEIIFTSGTTYSINFIATAFGKKYVNAGDEIVVSEMEHHSNILPWQTLCEEKNEIHITKLSFIKNAVLFTLGVILWILFGFFANKFSKQALPYLDGFITAFSLIATWMTTKKIIENWLYWILIDTLAIILFAYRGFYLLALLNIIYTLIAIVGYLKWRKKLI